MKKIQMGADLMYITGAFMTPHPPLIIPEVGKGDEREIMSTTAAYEEAARRISDLKPETIVVISPHSVMYADYFHISPGESARGDFGRFRAPKTSVEVYYDTEFVGELSRLARKENFPAGTLGQKERGLDHGTMIPLYFVGRHYAGFKVVRVGLSGLSFTEHYRLGRMIKEVSGMLCRRTVVIASGDLSHRLKDGGPYGYRQEGPEYDRKIMEIMGSGDFVKLFDFSESFCESAGECGHRSFLILAGALDRTGVRAELLSYEGPFGVGYGVCAYEIMGEDLSRDFAVQFERERDKRLSARREKEDDYVRLARKSLEYYVAGGRVIDVPEDTPGELTDRKAGAFVSLKLGGRLRGCIGTIGPTRSSLAEEIIENAVSAGCRDPRFSPVTVKELDKLEYSVDVLGEIEPVRTEAELDVKRYGVIVSKGCKRGLLLPNLEGVDTVEEQISIARQKADIGEDEPVQLERFEVVRHE